MFSGQKTRLRGTHADVFIKMPLDWRTTCDSVSRGRSGLPLGSRIYRDCSKRRHKVAYAYFSNAWIRSQRNSNNIYFIRIDQVGACTHP